MKGNFDSLVMLAQEIERRAEVKRDYTIRDSNLVMVDDDFFEIKDYRRDYGRFALTDVAHEQLAGKLRIPRTYYNDIRHIPGLRTHNVNTLLKYTGSKHLIRTLDNKARAFLSTRFRPIDNEMILEPFLKSIKGRDEKLDVVSCSITDRKLYIQIIFPRLEGEVVPGDVVQCGLTLTNSEVGCGAVNVETFIYRLVCRNGMVGKSILYNRHLGRRIGEGGDEDVSIYKRDTLRADNKSFTLRLRDTLQHALSETFFQNQLIQMRQASEDKVVDVKNTIENIGKKYGFTEKEKDGILNNLVKEDKPNRWTLANSITALAHDIENRDRQYECECIGNDIIELSPNQWEIITTTPAKKSKKVGE